MAVKINIGKLELPKPLGPLVSEQMHENEIEMLRSEVGHFETYADLPLRYLERSPLRLIAGIPCAGDGRTVTRPKNITLLMVPLMVLLIGWAVFRTAGALGFGPADSWVGALRFGLALMFVFTAVSHFVPRTRKDFVRMVPPQLPAPALLVTITGLLELAGAVGLLVPWLMRPAAFALAALLVALFPANVHAARSNMEIAGRPATPIAVRLPLQLFWVGALITVAIAAP